MRDRVIPAVIIGISIIAAAFLWGGRYTMLRDNEVVWRLDRYTGEIWACGVAVDQDETVGCGTLQEGGRLAINSN